MRRLLQARRDFFYITGLTVALSPIFFLVVYILSLFLNLNQLPEIKFIVIVISLYFVITLYDKYLRYHRVLLNLIVIPVNILLILFFLATFIFPSQRSPEYNKCREELVTRFGDEWSTEELNSPKFNEILQRCDAIK